VDHPRVCSDSHEDNNNFFGNFFFLCDFFAANREGLLGSIGYLIIHLACEDIGKYCIWSCSRKNDKDHHHDHQYEKKNQGRSTQEKRLFLTTIIFWFLHWVSSSSTMFNIPVSRRSTNATFIFWAIAHNMTILSLVWLSFFYCSKRSIHSLKNDNDDDESTITPPIFAAVNKHGLIVFILANLMTGAVNLSMNTLEATNSQAIAVIFCYLCAVGTVALFVDYIFRHGTRKQKKD
jgi:phosphatidylinositol glycan class W